MTNVPELRFDGFKGEWEEKKLAKIAKFSKGKGYSKTDLKNSGNPLYLYGEMYTNYKSQINDVETFTDKVKSNSVLSKGNEVLIPSSGETAIDLARASHMNIPKVLLGGDLNIIEPINGIDPHFLALELSNGAVKQSLAKKAQGKSVVHLYNTDIKNQKINYPVMDEQEKIGDLFKKIDDLIEIQEGKVAKMEDFKRSVLQKIFPKKGELVPEFRFDGFDNYGFDKGKINDFIVTHGSKNYIKQPADVGTYKVIQQGDIPIAGYSNEEPYKDFSDVILFGDHTLSLFKPYEPFLLSTDGIKIIFIENIDREYFYYLVQHVMPKSQGYKRHYKILRAVKVNIPKSYKEQKKIGQFFKNLDSQIENENRLLDSYKMMKKSLLQKMFV